MTIYTTSYNQYEFGNLVNGFIIIPLKTLLLRQMYL